MFQAAAAAAAAALTAAADGVAAGVDVAQDDGGGFDVGLYGKLFTAAAAGSDVGLTTLFLFTPRSLEDVSILVVSVPDAASGNKVVVAAAAAVALPAAGVSVRDEVSWLVDWSPDPTEAFVPVLVESLLALAAPRPRGF